MSAPQPDARLNGTTRSINSSVEILDYKKLTVIEDQVKKRRGPASMQGYAVWKRYDTALRKVIRLYGKVGWDDDVDFYHGGDWFHEFYDGFALRTTTALTIPLLHKLQTVVAQHHPDALLGFGGELGTPMQGLDVLVTPSAIYAAWYRDAASTCRLKLKKAKILIL